jgi:hypothetical protein
LSFTSVFITECLFKLIAFGIEGYFKNVWNQFDCFVVIASIVDLSLDLSGLGSVQGLSAGP